MAYNKENKLRLIIDVQKCYQRHKVEGVTKAYVHRTYIKPMYHITMKTLETYLNTRAEHELKLLLKAKEQKRNEQLKLFE